MIYIGIILCIAALGLFYGRVSSQKKLDTMASIETSQIGSLIETCRSVAREIGPGAFSEYVELKGIAVSETPLIGPFSHKPCVYSRAQVVREYEQEEIQRNTDTHQETRKWVRHSEVMSDKTETPEFSIKDETGTLKIDPKSAKIEAMESFDTFEPKESSSLHMDGPSLSWGNFTFSFSGDTGPRNRLIGFHFKEWNIPVGQKVYVLGQATDKESELHIGKPEGKQTFLVSTRSEEEMSTARQHSARMFTIAAAICGAAGLVLIVVGLVR